MFDTDSSVLTFIGIISHLAAPYKYILFHKSVQREPCDASSEIITVLSANVFQENLEYAKFTALVHKYNPDIVLTMESDEIGKKAPQFWIKNTNTISKVALDNTYGMHLYSKLKITNTVSLFCGG
jgi:endonuclease/exonuclease/phosphatase (EEP) superfamily protein YafD